MKNFYENLGSNTFLCCSLEESDLMDTFHYGMLSNNSINNVIPVLFSIENDKRFLKYNVSSKITLSEYFSGIVSKKRIINVFYSIVNAFIESEEYMIDQNLFVLDRDYIFVDVANLNASLICLPVVGYDNGIKLSDFFKNVMFTLRFDQTENNDYVAKILSYLNLSTNFSLVEFKKILTEILEDINSSNKRINDKIQTNTPEKVKSSKSLQQNDKGKQDNISTDSYSEIKKSNSLQYSELHHNIKEKKSDKGGKAEGNSEKKISLLHLMTNFSKENLELYKSQKNSNVQLHKTEVSFAVPNKNDEFETPNENIDEHEKKLYTNSQEQSKYTVSKATEDNGSKSANNNTVPKFKQEIKTDSKIDFGSTVYFDENKLNSTILIDDNIQLNNVRNISPHIIRRKTQEHINLTVSPFKIGKEKTFVDYCVTGNPAISGCHAFIICDNDKYYIKDTNSTNHVYINKKRIESNALVSINHNDVIRLANEDFDFKLY